MGSWWNRTWRWRKNWALLNDDLMRGMIGSTSLNNWLRGRNINWIRGNRGIMKNSLLSRDKLLWVRLFSLSSSLSSLLLPQHTLSNTLAGLYWQTAHQAQQATYVAGKIAKPLRGGGGGHNTINPSHSSTAGSPLSRVQQDEPKRRMSLPANWFSETKDDSWWIESWFFGWLRVMR